MLRSIDPDAARPLVKGRTSHTSPATRPCRPSSAGAAVRDASFGRRSSGGLIPFVYMRARYVGAMVFAVALTLVPAASAQPAPDSPLLVVLTETGQTRDDLPVYALHPKGDSIATVLSRGLPLVMLRAYQKEQEYLRRKDGITPEPAYLLMSSHSGGYARYGFWLDGEKKDDVAYVDLRSTWALTGKFGAMDQLFPHELFHAIRKQLVSALEEGYANQVHALGLRTDRMVAFNEGVAEHFQAMAIDHPDADPATHALAAQTDDYASALRDLEAYRRELDARLAVATRMRMGFILWYSNDEDVLRYFGIKDNRYAHETDIPPRLLDDDPYRAYLVDSIVPGTEDDPAKPVAQLIRTEGVVSALMYRWANDPNLRHHYREPAFYEQFGVTLPEADPGPSEETPAGETQAVLERLVPPLENVYLKMFDALYTHKPAGLIEFVDGYKTSFPDEAAWVDAAVRETFLGQPAVPSPAIWLANPNFHTGTTLFDQFRALPRMHTFDLNAASATDLVAVSGVDDELATAILAAAPFVSVEALADVPGMSPEIVARFKDMQAEMQRFLNAEEEEGGELSLQSLMMGFVWRLVLALVIATIAGAILYRMVNRGGMATGDQTGADGPPARRYRPSWWRSAIDGLGAAFLGILSGWLGGYLLSGTPLAPIAPILGTLVGVVVIFGVPAALWALRRRAKGVRPARVLMAWLVAAVPAVIMVVPWF